MEHVQVGVVEVDSGTIMVGDPCYTLPEDGFRRTPTAREWRRLCEVIEGHSHSEPFGSGYSLVVQAPHGDGMYPVMAEVDAQGGVCRLIIDLTLACSEGEGGD